MNSTRGLSSDNFVVIQGFMCNELDLKGNELLVFALIYGFCQDGKSVYSGGRQYIADTFNISVRTVTSTLQSLVDQGLIVRHDSDDYVHPDIYTVAGNRETLVGSEKISLGVVKKLQGGSEKISPNNIDNKLENNIDNSTSVELEQPTVTPHRRLITDIEPVKKPAKKKNLYESCREQIIEFAGDNEKLRDKLIEWLGVRLERRDTPFGAKTFASYLKKLAGLTSNADEQIKIIQQAIDKSHLTFYPLSDYSKYKRGKQDPSVFSEFGKVKSDIRKDEVIVNVQY